MVWLGVAVAFAALLMYDPRLAATRQGFGPAIGLVVGLAALGLGYVFHGRFKAKRPMP